MKPKNVEPTMTNSPATKYFIEYWEDLYGGVSSERDLLSAFNPRVVIQELLDEIIFNELKNKMNMEFFQRTIGKYQKSDPGSQQRLKASLTIILKEFEHTKQRPAYLPQLCQNALASFEKLEYLEDTVEALLEITEKGNIDTKDKQKLQTIARHLIVEFRQIGYAEEDIRKIPNQLFSKIQCAEEHAIWEFPNTIEYPKERTAESIEKYNKELESYQNNLTEKDRIAAFITLAKHPKENFRYIFRVFGIHGTKSFNLRDVLFYSPLIEPIISESEFTASIDEQFRDETNKRSFNASTSVSAMSINSGETIARAKIEDAFTFLRQAAQGESPLRLSKSYIALSGDGDFRGSSFSAFESNRDDLTKIFTIRDDEISVFNEKSARLEKTLSIANNNGWGKRFSEASHWLRKAEESTSPVDQLLSYWITIETLCAKTGSSSENWFRTKPDQEETDIFLIREIVGKTRALGKCYQHGWMIYHDLSDSLYRKINGIELPEELIRSAQLSPKTGDSISLANLIRDCDEIEKHIPDGLLKEQLSELKKFYSDNNHALTTLREHLDKTQDELLFLYRMRNKIAHDGNNSNPLLQYLCKMASSFAHSFYAQIIESCCSRNLTSLSDILIRKVQEFEMIELRLNNENPKAVLLSMDT